ncbi:MAG: type II toxin-antitoxin system Phd/YefM family antitoxin [Actinomycetospora chiangmaiensis]|nr:type II toxin-antitoxin system Phd/YefM family antitoxin [Actinomycetospora chiangmaiensis]
MSPAVRRRVVTRVSDTEFRARLATCLDRVEQDQSELIITRQDHAELVVMPLAELNGLRETMPLLSPPANAKRLLRALRSSMLPKKGFLRAEPSPFRVLDCDPVRSHRVGCALPPFRGARSASGMRSGSRHTTSRSVDWDQPAPLARHTSCWIPDQVPLTLRLSGEGARHRSGI